MMTMSKRDMSDVIDLNHRLCELEKENAELSAQLVPIAYMRHIAEHSSRYDYEVCPDPICQLAVALERRCDICGGVIVGDDYHSYHRDGCDDLAAVHPDCCPCGG